MQFKYVQGLGIPVSSLGIPKSLRVFPFCFNSWPIRFRSLSGSNSKGNKRRRYMKIIKRTAHGIFSPDGTKTESRLTYGAHQKSSSRFSPACPVCQFFKIFLERKVCPAPIRPTSPRGVSTARRTAYTAPWKGLHSARSGSKPCAMKLALSVWPRRTGDLAAIPSAGVFWYLPPKGIRTVPAPTVESKRSTSPCWDAFIQVTHSF